MTRPTDKNRRNLYIKQEDYDYLAQIGNGYADGLRKAVEAHRARAQSKRYTWMPINSAPKNGAEFQAWLITEDGDGFWESRCKFDENGSLGVWGRVDYDQDDWDFGLIHLKATHWMPQPCQPTTNNQNAVKGGENKK